MKKRTRDRGRPRPMALRTETQREQLVRMLWLGWSTKRMAKALHCSTRSVRYAISLPEFQGAYAQYERNQLATVDRAMPKLLLAAVEVLARQLRHRDWKARDSAVTKILQLHGPVLERLILRRHEQGRPVPPGTPVGMPPMDDWTPEQRDAARVVLQAMRQRQPKQLPPGMTRPEAEA